MHFRRQTDGLVIIIYILVSDINFFVSLCTRDRLTPKHDHLDYDAVFFLTNLIYDSFFLLLQPKNRDLSFFFLSSFFVSLQSVGRYHRHIPINQVPAESKNPKFRLFKRLLIPSLLDDIDVSQLQNWTCTGNSSLQCESREWVQHSIKNEIRHEKPSVGGKDVKQNAFDYAWTHQPV